ncbi:hypothetical protein NC653_028882 [Populus alba x Populus x berolinensis]|uniref:Uncharacterized protein n=1 Tax=Populus alba x Populus x berolinensis TaxID=444605 RepID=A0AAD6M104_9ROSI|nr:hypothetical protein NC653_028882 [Populus alba x Populus x berolinensis]
MYPTSQFTLAWQQKEGYSRAGNEVGSIVLQHCVLHLFSNIKLASLLSGVAKDRTELTLEKECQLLGRSTGLIYTQQNHIEAEIHFMQQNHYEAGSNEKGSRARARKGDKRRMRNRSSQRQFCNYIQISSFCKSVRHLSIIKDH